MGEVVTGAQMNTHLRDNLRFLKGADGLIALDAGITVQKGADIASATALTLGADGNYFVVTGTTTITSISNRVAGAEITLRFAAALTLTHNATSLILGGAANVVTVAGDIFHFVSEGGGNWRESNVPLAYGTVAGTPAEGNHTTPTMTATVAGHVPTPPNNANQVLLGTGVYGDVPGGGATKEFFVPVTFGTGGITLLGDRPHTSLAQTQEAAMAFFVPNDFTSITNAVIVCRRGSADTNLDWDIFSDYAAIGEAYNLNSESNTASTYVPANIDNQLHEISVSGILSTLAAGDHVGIRVLNNQAAQGGLNVIGLRFRYT